MMTVETMTRMRKITHRKTVRRKRMIVRSHRVLPRGRYGAGICPPPPGHGVAVLGSQSQFRDKENMSWRAVVSVPCYCCSEDRGAMFDFSNFVSFF